MSRWNPFDDESRYVDRFGLLLLVTSVAVITLSLVDLSSNPPDLASDLGLLAVSIFVGATLLLSLRARCAKLCLVGLWKNREYLLQLPDSLFLTRNAFNEQCGTVVSELECQLP